MEARIILSIMVFFAFLGFINLMLPEPMRFMSMFDFGWMGGGIIGVSGACAIATGIPCAAALGIFGFGSFILYVVVSVEWLKIILFTPIVIVLMYIVSKLGRGGG